MCAESQVLRIFRIDIDTLTWFELRNIRLSSTVKLSGLQHEAFSYVVNLEMNNSPKSMGSFQHSKRSYYYIVFFSHIHVHVGIYPLFISLFEHVNLFHLLEFIDYRIARLPSEIVTCTFFFFRTTFLQTAVYIPTILSALWIVLAILFWTSQSAQSARFTYVYICQLTIFHWCILMNI